jgi:hypothetical protein
MIATLQAIFFVFVAVVIWFAAPLLAALFSFAAAIALTAFCLFALSEGLKEEEED